MQEKRIILKETTLECLRILKRDMRVSSYDSVISKLIEKTKNGRVVPDLTNSDMLIEIIKKANKNLNRIEAIHTRIGFYERQYFMKINDINDEVFNLRDLQHTNDYSRKKNNQKENDIVLYEEPEILKKLNLLKSKCIRNDDVFNSNYTIQLSEKDYKTIFGDD